MHIIQWLRRKKRIRNTQENLESGTLESFKSVAHSISTECSSKFKSQSNKGNQYMYFYVHTIYLHFFKEVFHVNIQITFYKVLYEIASQCFLKSKVLDVTTGWFSLKKYKIHVCIHVQFHYQAFLKKSGEVT